MNCTKGQGDPGNGALYKLPLGAGHVGTDGRKTEVIPPAPTYLGSMDASKSGIDGVWFPQDVKFTGAIQPHADDSLTSPVLWR
jgi:hypothetical protein